MGEPMRARVYEAVLKTSKKEKALRGRLGLESYGRRLERRREP